MKMIHCDSGDIVEHCLRAHYREGEVNDNGVWENRSETDDSDDFD